MKWVSAWSSVIGSSHVESGTPCQDCSVVTPIPETNWIVAAVADGAGSSSCSQIGAYAAVHKGSQKVCERFKANGWLADWNLITAEGWEKEAYHIFKEIRYEIVAMADEQGVSYTDLACTLVLVVSNGEFVCCAHVGDGRAAFLDEKDTWIPIMVPYKGEEANQTVFVTSDHWLEGIQTKYFESQFHSSRIKAFTLMSDGAERAAFQVLIRDEADEEKFYDPNRPYKPFFDRNIEVLKLLQHKSAPQDEINKLWYKFLEQGNERLKLETDDKSIVLSILHKVPHEEQV